MSTAANLAVFVGCTGTWTATNGLQVSVSIVDARCRYGDVDYLITPMAGSGQVWVSAYKVNGLTAITREK